MSNGIHIVVVNGSVRDGNYTGKACALVMESLESLGGVTSDLILTVDYNLPQPGTKPNDDSKDLRDRMNKGTGFILATPEYHGGFSSVIKLVIENLGFPSSITGKPVALLGVAAGRIGAIKSLESLRGICSHIGGLVLPGPVSVANVQEVFDEEGNCLDEEVEKMVKKLPGILVEYIRGKDCPDEALEATVRKGA